MKKTIKRVIILLFLIFSLFLSIRSSAQKDSLTSKYIYEDVKSGIRQLVANLQGPARHTYEIYVKQHYISGIISIFAPLSLFIPFLIICIIGLNRGSFKYEKWNVWSHLTIIFGLMAFAMLAVTFANFITKPFTEWQNPEYWAIQDIINNFKH
jgi:hypothetical protein